MTSSFGLMLYSGVYGVISCVLLKKVVSCHDHRHIKYVNRFTT